MIGVIARHESGQLIGSAVTWVIAALLAGLFGFLFLQQLEIYLANQAQLALQDHAPGLSGWLAARFMAPLAMVFTLIAPLLAMRSFSDEFRQNTWPLWQSSPVSTVAIVLGKYLGVMCVLTGLVLLASLMVLAMALFVSIDLAILASATVGLLLCAGACAATGLFFSSLTQQAMIAVIASFALLLLLWLVGSASLGSVSLDSLQSLSISAHITGFFQGYPRTNDVVWFLLFISLFLSLTVVRLDALRHLGR